VNNKVSEFPGRKVEDQPAPGPALGGDQGAGKRNGCGSCIHWRKASEIGLGQGVCMESPPLAFPITDKAGNLRAQSLSRPILSAEYEGCDRWDDGAPEGAELVEVDDVSTGERRTIAVPR
jgi:hypothetical protein